MVRWALMALRQAPQQQQQKTVGLQSLHKAAQVLKRKSCLYMSCDTAGNYSLFVICTGTCNTSISLSLSLSIQTNTHSPHAITAARQQLTFLPISATLFQYRRHGPTQQRQEPSLVNNASVNLKPCICPSCESSLSQSLVMLFPSS